MTKKQMKQLAIELYNNELIHQSSSTSKEEKDLAEARILTITSQVMALKNGMETMLEIDEMVQNLNSKNN